MKNISEFNIVGLYQDNKRRYEILELIDKHKIPLAVMGTSILGFQPLFSHLEGKVSNTFQTIKSTLLYPAHTITNFNSAFGFNISDNVITITAGATVGLLLAKKIKDDEEFKKKFVAIHGVDIIFIATLIGIIAIAL